MVNPGDKLKKILLISGITGAVYGGFKYLLPLVVPFIFAYGAALWLRPSVRYLERRLKFRFLGKERGIPASVIGGAEILAVFGGILGLLYFGGSRIFRQLYQFTNAFPGWINWLDVNLTGLCRKLEAAFGLKNDYLVASARDMVGELGNAVKTSTMTLIMNTSMAILRNAASMVIFLIIFFVASLLFLQEMDDIRERKSDSMFHREFSLIGRRLVNVGSAWLKTQLVIMSITSIICTAGLFFIGNPYSLLLGIGIGFLDALPIFGTGTVLIPWGIFMLIQKKWKSGLVLLGLYVVCYFIRQILEAKIMGGKVGLSALETLISMYVGLKLFGIAGFLLGPMGLLIIEDFVDLYWQENGNG